jgi:hypothetical protein
MRVPVLLCFQEHHAQESPRLHWLSSALAISKWFHPEFGSGRISSVYGFLLSFGMAEGIRDFMVIMGVLVFLFLIFTFDQDSIGKLLGRKKKTGVAND